MSDQPKGPNPDNLRHLHGLLSTAAEGIATGKIQKSRPAPQPTASPTKYCEVCMSLFDRKFKHEGPLESAVCPDCTRLLFEGWTAFVTVDSYCFGKSKALADMAGKVVQVQDATMLKLKEQFEVKQKLNPKPESTPEPPRFGDGFGQN